ncbi:MarR family transcriptional regulator [Amycolatopsis antarctica]|uniref:MarR family transcriptional regulator n=1 Tax=Amycolatopsis antarctica TaxID=1854586 RepID=A0A263CW67_9PSEU|nr:MarR family transcriptional regulator [Amycolatopsis antarctica]OZM70390.1 MarR family transcriptional regulator [Amycolatopsis antarctica]
MRTAIVDKLMAVTSMFQRDMTRAFAGTPLTESRAAVLWTLTLSGPSTQQILAEALSVTARNISGLVDALEQHGYVQRVPHSSDRRAVLVKLTPNGETAMARMQEEHARLEAELRGVVAPEHLDALEQGIDAIIAHLATSTSSEQTEAEGDR